VTTRKPSRAVPGGGRVSSHEAPFPLTASCALFLDIDGTLLDLAPSPSAVAVDPHVTALLPALSGPLGGACALVTGRSVTDVNALFPGLRLPISGQHGCEQRDVDGTIHLYAKNRAMLDRLRKLFAAFAAEHPGFLLEDKGATLALHYRQAPYLAGTLEKTLRGAMAEESGHGYLVQGGKELIEVRPESRDKGTSIRDFMRKPPFKGRTPVFVGDDVGDEPGFALVQRLGGAGIKVGPGNTRARYRLRDVAAVREWLGIFLAAPLHAEQGK
jgi:trehalose 6-phosphate phosphatase